MNKDEVIQLKTFIEIGMSPILLEDVPAYFHITVTTIERYVLDLLKKHHLFQYQFYQQNIIPYY